MTLSNQETPAPRTDPDPERERLAAEVLDELAILDPSARLNEFRSWQAGSLSLIHLQVLSLLEAEGALSMAHLADALDVSVASVTGIIDRLERRGLVKRRRGEADRRVVLVSRTPAGEAVFSDLFAHRRERLAKMVGSFSDDELAATLVFLRAIRRVREAFLAERVSGDEKGHATSAGDQDIAAR